jgi:hypothetical protein
VSGIGFGIFEQLNFDNTRCYETSRHYSNDCDHNLSFGSFRSNCEI